jgi:hypothetical protein
MRDHETARIRADTTGPGMGGSELHDAAECRSENRSVTELESTHRMRVGFSLIVVVLTTLFLVACGDDEDSTTATTTQTTTITSAESEAAAEEEGLDSTSTTESDSTTTPLSTSPSTEAQASSDAAAAIPGGSFVVADAEPEEATTTAEIDPVTGEPVPQDTTVLNIDPATGLPVQSANEDLTPVTTRGGRSTPDPVLAGSEAILSRPFSADSPWNTTVQGVPIDRNSDRWIEESDIRVALVEDENGDFVEDERELSRGLIINTTKWTVPVFSNTQEGAVERIAICRQFDCGEDAVTSVVIPLDACPDPRYDGWMTVIDDTTRTAYDFWRARCEADGSISYHYVKAWDLDGVGFQENLGVSARGSGLPLFAGLITPEEIRDGSIDHALAIAIPGAATRRYVRPASRTNGTGRRTSLPEGARIVLKEKVEKRLTKRLVRNKVQRRTARIIITALRRYGAIVVDRSKTPTMFAQRNANWTNILPLNLLQDLKMDQFQVVQAGEIFFDPPRDGEGTFDSTDVGSPPVTSTGDSTLEFGDPGIDLGEILP